MNPKWILLSVEPIRRYCQTLRFAKREHPYSIITNTADGPSDKERCQKFKCLFKSRRRRTAGAVLWHPDSADAARTEILLWNYLPRASVKHFISGWVVCVCVWACECECISNLHSCSRAGTFPPTWPSNASVRQKLIYLQQLGGGKVSIFYFAQVSCCRVKDRNAFLKSATEAKVLKIQCCLFWGAPHAFLRVTH